MDRFQKAALFGWGAKPKVPRHQRPKEEWELEDFVEEYPELKKLDFQDIYRQAEQRVLEREVKKHFHGSPSSLFAGSKLLSEKKSMSNRSHSVGIQKAASFGAMMGKLAGEKPLSAVIIKGNPKFIDGNQKATDFYNNLQTYLESKGYEVTQDPGKAYTSPPKANVWIGHSRGVDRLRFAPEGTSTIRLGAIGGINHPEDTQLNPGDIPTDAHYVLTDDMLQQLDKALSPAPVPKGPAALPANVIESKTPKRLF